MSEELADYLDDCERTFTLDTLKEKIALRRAALEKENKEKELEEQKGDQQKTILNDIASKAEFVRKMSQTFG